ncbi:E3 ubiquitin-protein ligase RNF31 isoform X1 [Octopus bimaculoides]|uniref:Uncharacterized protein n=1 Tax=Octopus bimaculoides TaxID=37653 RepID=A0A0L8FX27_OCTBM|nr:E3 ubiquitin-protein ligase RNF31 isoform X1 [Octopus bimaculoides]|eukprot:XP_014786196.1 PREDICTED: E3 ubiquitin-protein ligase RNF31-like isoform X1 [Octopus bimaculoides]
MPPNVQRLLPVEESPQTSIIDKPGEENMETKCPSQEEGQQIDTRTKVAVIRENMKKMILNGFSMANLHHITLQILYVCCKLNMKFEKHDFTDLIIKNGESNLPIIQNFLLYLQNLCNDLLKATASTKLQIIPKRCYDDIKKVKGADHILKKIGFTPDSSNGAKISKSMIADKAALISWIIDLAIAQCELINYMKDKHPYPGFIKKLLEESEVEQGCSICGQPKPNMICSSCEDKQLCTSCDGTWHSHPKRVDHIRSLIKDTSPPSLLSGISSLHQSADPYISQKQYQDALDMDPKKLERILQDLSNTLESMECDENFNAKKIELTRKRTVFTNVYIKKVDKELQKLSQHIDNVDRHIQTLVLDDRDFYERDEYVALTQDKQFIQQKISEYREKQKYYMLLPYKDGKLFPSHALSQQEYGYMSDSQFNRDNHRCKDSSVMLSSSYGNWEKSPVHKPPMVLSDNYLEFQDINFSVPPESSQLDELAHLIGKSPQKTPPLTTLFSSFGGIPDDDSGIIYWKCSTCGHKNSPDREKCFNCDKWKECKTRKDTPSFTEANENMSTTFQTVAAEQDQILLEKKIAQQQYRNSLQMLSEGNNPFDYESAIEPTSPCRTVNQPCINLEDDRKNLSFNKVDMATASPDGPDKIERVKVSSEDLSQTGGMKALPEDLHKIDEKRSRIEMVVEAGEIVKQLRLAEQQGIDVDTMVIALENVDDSVTPMEWIQTQWPDYITTATALILNRIGVQFHKEEVTCALKKHKGNVDKAVEECTHSYQKKLKKSQEFGNFSEEDFKQAFQKHSGDVDLILQELFTPSLDEYEKRIWAINEPLNRSLSADLINLLKDNQIDVQRRVRAAYSEIAFKGWRRAEYVVGIIDKSLQTLENCDIADIVEIVQNTTSMDLALKQLKIECKICFNSHPQTKIMTLCSCDCKFCIGCFQQYFELKINNEPVVTWTCPICGLPELSESDTVRNYFNILGLQIKQNNFSQKTNILYETKLRDWHLQRDPNFRWCQQCGGGFLFDGKGLKMSCPFCNRAMCFKCEKVWGDQHQNLSCEKYNEWLINNHPENQAQGLEMILKKNGIICPLCKYVYFLSKGGCIHFTCKECRHQFCSGCQKRFYSKDECKKFKSCCTKGIHAHHPRNCLYYLRDNHIQELQKLLQMSHVNFDTESKEQVDVCPVIEQKEISSDTFKDAKCGKCVSPNNAGFCTDHYKEYLITLINENKVDPIELFTKQNIIQVLSRYDKTAPDQGNQSESEYINTLKKLLQQVEPILK